MKYLKKIGLYIKNNKYKSIAALVIIILLYLIFGHHGSKAKFETAKVSRTNVVETVSVTGSVSPVSKADIAFQKSGAVSKLYVSVGDSVKAGDPIASLDNASDAASYQSTLATLADMSRSLRPEEESAEQAKVTVAKTALSSAKEDAVNFAHDSYTKVQSAFANYIDAFFTNPSSANPTLNIATDSYTTTRNLQAERVTVNQALAHWANELSVGDTDVSQLVALSQSHLAVVQAFVKHLASVVGLQTTGNSGESQSVITARVASVNSALSTVNQAIDSLTTASTSLGSAEANLTQAQSNYTLRVAGNSSDAIAAQEAKVNQAAAELAKDTVRAPIDGIITKVSPDLGEYVAAGSTQFSVQSLGSYKIEAFVPEADIAKVSLGNLASTTLDAYGSDTYFEAHVVSIDPAETILEGVPTYKVTLYFKENDSRIRSGMTANLDILTHERDGVIAIPYRAVIDDNGAKTVRISNAGKTAFSTTSVMTGLKGSDGLIEIVSGLREGQEVVTYVQ